MYISTVSLEITLILLFRGQFSETFLNVETNCLKMTDLKNIIEILFPDDGVSVICVTVHVLYCVSSFYFSGYGIDRQAMRKSSITHMLSLRFRRKKVS